MSISRADLSLELRNNLIIGLSIGFIGGGAVGFLMTATTLFLNPAFLHSIPDMGLLTLVLVGVYILLALAIGLGGAILKTLYFLFNKQRLSDTKTAAFAMGAFFFLLVSVYGISWCRWNGVGGASRETLFTIGALPIYIVVLGVGLVLSRLFTYAMYVLIVYWKKPHLARSGDWTKAFFVLGYVALFTILFMVVMRTTTSPAPSRDEGLNATHLGAYGQSVHLVGLDGMTRERLLSLAEEDIVPGLASVLERAAWIRLDPGAGLIPPVQWTSLATGQTYRRHGITDYQVQTLRGLRTPLVVRPGHVGIYEAFNHVLPFFRLTESLALRSQMRQSKALWDLAGEVGLKSCVTGWWATWPAEKIAGYMVTDHAYLKLQDLRSDAAARDSAALWDRSVASKLEAETYPEDLLLELAPLLVPYDGDPPEGLPSSLFESDRFYAAAHAYLRKRRAPDLSLLYLPGPDVMKRLLSRHSPDGWRDPFDRSLQSYLAFLAKPLGECLAAAGADITALVILPGWREAKESGWLILEGAAVEPGAATEESYGLADAAATLIYLLGLPVARDLGGRPVLGVLREGFVDDNPPAEVTTYGLRPPGDGPVGSTRPDKEMLERLRSLGYI